MTDPSKLLDHYQRTRGVRFRLNNRLAGMIPKKTLEECAKILGFSQKGIMVFETEDEASVLMDYCLYYPGPDGRNLVAKYLDESPPADPDERVALQSMARAYYSIFQVIDVRRGVGVSVQDLLRGETGFLVDVGFGSTASRRMALATRIIPIEGYLVSGGAGLPVDPSAVERISKELSRSRYSPETTDFKNLTPQQEAEVAAIVIRQCRATGMSSHIAYAEPGEKPQARAVSAGARRVGRNDPCPCGSGKKFKVCCNPNGY